MSMSKLTPEQLRRIEENKQKALAKLAEKGRCQNEQPCGQKTSADFSVGKSDGAQSSTFSGVNRPQDVGLNIGIHDLYGKAQNTGSTSESILSLDSAVQDRIEQNRLKALAKRAEKLNQSPIKSDKSSFGSVPEQRSDGNKFSVHGQNATGFQILPSALQTSTASGSYPQERLQNNLAQKGCTNNGQTGKQTSAQSSGNLQQKGTNIFSTFSGTPVRGDCALVSRDRFEVKAGYSAPLIELFKTMNTKLYDAVTKKWSFSLSEYNRFMSAVASLKPAVEVEPLPKGLLTAFAAQIGGATPPKEIPIADLSHVDSSLVNSLMSFQRQGVNFGVYKNGRVLIADDMGLGKTIQAICLSAYYRSEWPLLVVVPSSVRFDWSQQFQRWIPTIDPQSVNVVVTGKDNCTAGLINILSYDLMAKNAEELKRKRFQVIIMDECHLLKNYKTARYKAAIPLLQSAKRVILLSGTPALSRPSELYTQISAVCPFLFKFHDFGVRYCAGKHQAWGWDYSGSSNMEELQILLRETIMIRRLKKDVLTELPDKVRQMILLDPSSIEISKELKSASKVMTSANLKKKDKQGALLDFFHKSGAAKIKAIKSYVDDLLEGEKKLLVFAHHGDILDGIENTVRSKIEDRYIRIDGKTSSEQRNVFCKKFQHNDNIRVAILSITAANAGLNLSSANLVVFAELFWNPGILVQAEDRAHRIGQRDSVCVQYLVATGTSDDHVWPMIQKKLDVLGRAGLTKDNFSSAETTRLTDQRQEEISRFLDESFHIDSGFLDSEDSLETRSPSKVMKQQSILQYASPVKTHPRTLGVRQSPSKKRLRQKTLFQFGCGHSVENNTNVKQSSTGESGEPVPEMVGEADICQKRNSSGCFSNQVKGHDIRDNGQGQAYHFDDEFELEDFLNDSDSELDAIMEPAGKK